MCKWKDALRNLILAATLIAVLAAVWSAGCSVIPMTTGSSATSGTSTKPAGTTPAPSGTAPVTTATAQPMQFKLLADSGHILLIPNYLKTNGQGVPTGEIQAWQLSNQLTWETAAYAARKVLSVKGHDYFDTNDSVLDICEVKIGRWTGCCLRRGDQAQDSLDRRILREIIINELTFAPKSKDYAILQIFDDLYAVDSQGQARMISQRQVGGYNYDTIPKKGIPDRFAWAWTTQYVCSPRDNRIFYLTARDGQFYSVWSIDLDRQTETRFCPDVTIWLEGTGNGKLLAILDQNKDSDPFGKLYSTDDPGQFILLTDREWAARDGWLYRQYGATLTMLGAGRQVIIEGAALYSPFMLDDQELWLSYVPRSASYRSFLRIDLANQTCAMAALNGDITLTGYQKLMADLAASRMTFDQAAAAGIQIKVEN